MVSSVTVVSSLLVHNSFSVGRGFEGRVAGSREEEKKKEGPGRCAHSNVLTKSTNSRLQL